MIRLGLLGSTRGTNMLALIEAIKTGRLAASIEVVLSNKSDAPILERATQHGLKAEYVASSGCTPAEYDACLTQRLEHYEVDLVVLIGYMRILSSQFVSHWHNRVINVHPSLLPAFAGKMDRSVHEAVLASGVKETGCTIHFVTDKVDAGPVLLRKKCPVIERDTIESLRQRVQGLEGMALIEAIQILERRLKSSQ